MPSSQVLGPKGPFPKSICALAGLSLLLGAWGTPIGESQKYQAFLTVYESSFMCAPPWLSVNFLVEDWINIIFLLNSNNNFEQVDFSIRLTNHFFHVFIMNHYRCKFLSWDRTLVVSVNNSVVSRFFACTPSVIQQIVRICEVVD